MKRVKKTVTGVLPNPRDTLELQELNVIIEGQHPVASGQPDPHFHHSIAAVENANLGPAPAQYSKLL